MINTIINDDCRNVFPEIKRKYKNIFLLFDPPYNIKFNYDKYEDNLTDEEYTNLIKTFKDIPSAIIHYPIETMKYIVPVLGVPQEVMAWCYASNLPKRFRLISTYERKPDFNKVKQPYKNLTDKRIRKRVAEGSKGSPLYEWFSDINIVKNVSKDKTIHPCPIPIKLFKRLIKLLVKEDEIVIDPFCGTGNCLLACKELDINYIGIEISERYCQESQARIDKYDEEHKDIFNIKK